MKKVWIGALSVGVIGFITTVSILIHNNRVYEQAEKIYDWASDCYVVRAQEPEYVEEETFLAKAGVIEPVDYSVEWYQLADVRMDELREKYPDVVAWIYFENEDISYPVVYTEGDNASYLRTTFDGHKNTAGSIFIDGSCSSDFTDPNTIIYGHNMKDKTMFGKLKAYHDDADYYAEHPYFQIFTPSALYRYQIFMCGDIPADHEVYGTFGKNPDNVWSIVETLREQADYPTDVEVGGSDHIVTLSTCINDDAKRFVVSAVRVATHER